MRNAFKHALIVAMTLLVLTASALPVVATAGNVRYSGDAGQFIFTPGTDHSPTDLFPNFKDVMPGDTLRQTIAVHNDASDGAYVNIYLRALGAQEDGQSGQFLSQLSLSVKVGESRLFDAPAHESAQMSDWVLLGTLQSGGSAQLDVELNVPVTLDNQFMSQIGCLDWQFMVEEFPVGDPDMPVDPDEPVDPELPDVPKTGDQVPTGLFLWLFTGSGAAIVLLLWLMLRRREEREQDDD